MNRRGWCIAIFSVVLAAYALAGWRAVLAHTDPTEMDTAAYLDAALQIRQTGGILQHIPNMIRGVYTEATQHPLYLLAISPFAQNDIRAFVQAKLVSYGIGFVFLTVFFFAVRRFFGTGTAGGAAWLWLMSAGFLTLVTTVACEGLLGVFIAAFWWALAEGRENRRWWWAAGFFAGLAFLTKSLGILMLPVFVLTAVWWDRKDLKKLLTSPAFWGFFILFVLTALPLFIRNAVVYGSPLYSDSSGVLWIDRWDEFSYERAAEGRFTLAKYLSTHSPGRIAQIFGEGLWKRDAQMFVDGLKPLPFWQAIPSDFLRGFHHRTAAWQEGWAAGLALLAGIGWWANRRQAAAVPTLVLWGIFAVFVGWYSKIFAQTPPTRLLYPALIWVPVYAALGCKALADRLRFGLREGLGVKISMGLLILMSAGLWMNGAEARTDVRKSYEYPPVIKMQMALANSFAKPGDRVLVSQQFESYLFYLKGQMRLEYIGWPKVDSLDDLIQWVQKEKIRFAFVDLATALYNPQVFQDYYRVERPGILRRLRPLPQVFQPVAKDPRIPDIFDIYAIQTLQL